MSNKLIDLNALSEYKVKSDLKYQNKLTAGDSISLNNGIISANPYFSGDLLSGSLGISNSLTDINTIRLEPGTYYLRFTCQFASNTNGWRYCIFESEGTSSPKISFQDCRRAVNNATTQTAINAIFQVSASEFPNGRTFVFRAQKSNGSANQLTAYPRAYYLKF